MVDDFHVSNATVQCRFESKMGFPSRPLLPSDRCQKKSQCLHIKLRLNLSGGVLVPILTELNNRVPIGKPHILSFSSLPGGVPCKKHHSVTLFRCASD